MQRAPSAKWLGKTIRICDNQRDMKTWLRLLIVGIEALVVLAAVYFEPTYCVRGTLWGEPFYNGRPTSFWRERIDAWVARFDSLEDCERCLLPFHINIEARKAGAEDSERTCFAVPMQVTSLFDKAIFPRPPRAYERFVNFIRGSPDEGPKVLAGYPDAVPVLLKLAQFEEYRGLIGNALWRANEIRKMRQSLMDEGFVVLVGQ
jgi:hypothetical protein